MSSWAKELFKQLQEGRPQGECGHLWESNLWIPHSSSGRERAQILPEGGLHREVPWPLVALALLRHLNRWGCGDVYV